MKVCESETYEFPYCFKYKQLYRVFVRYLNLGKSERKLKYLRMELLLKLETKRMVIMSRIFMLVIKERMFRFH